MNNIIKHITKIINKVSSHKYVLSTINFIMLTLIGTFIEFRTILLSVPFFGDTCAVWEFDGKLTDRIVCAFCSSTLDFKVLVDNTVSAF